MGSRVIRYSVTSRHWPQIIWNYYQPTGNPLPEYFLNLLSHVSRGFSSTNDEDSSKFFQRKLELTNVENLLVEFQVFSYDSCWVRCCEGFVHCSKNVTM